MILTAHKLQGSARLVVSLTAATLRTALTLTATQIQADIAQMPQEVYYIDRKVAETRDFVEFEMVSSLDLANARAPRRL